MLLPFPPWRPDVAGLNGSTTATARGVLRYEDGYLPFPGFAEYSDELGETVYGAFLAYESGGTRVIFAGTAGGLYRLATDGTWTDVTQAATTYSATNENRWSFAQFGDFIIAVTPNDAPQVYNMAAPATFVDLPGSPPDARWVAVWGDFLVLGGLALHPTRVHWSGLNDIEEWTPGTKFSDFQDFPDGGVVQGMTASDTALIFQETSIRRAVYLPGSPLIFQFEKLTEDIGTKSPYSIVQREQGAFFIAEDGFYFIDGGGVVSPIGAERVNRTYVEDTDGGWLVYTDGVLDPTNQRVYWASRSKSSPGAALNRLWIYDFQRGEWTDAIVDLQILAKAATPGYTLEDLDAFGTMETLPFSLDSRVWVGGAATLAGFTSGGAMGFFSGANQAAVVETAELGATDGQLTRITEVAPVVDTTAALVRIGRRRVRSGSVAWTADRATSPGTGRANINSRARYQRIRVTIPAGTTWSYLQGVDLTSRPDGMR